MAGKEKNKRNILKQFNERREINGKEIIGYFDFLVSNICSVVNIG